MVSIYHVNIETELHIYFKSVLSQCVICNNVFYRVARYWYKIH